MPNIEHYGCIKTSDVKKLFLGKPYEKELVFTEVFSAVSDITGKPQPFLRLYITLEDPDEIIEILYQAKYDVEVIILHKFIPKP